MFGRFFVLLWFVMIYAVPAKAAICFAPGEDCQDSPGIIDTSGTRAECSSDCAYRGNKGEGWNCTKCNCRGNMWKCEAKQCKNGYSTNVQCAPGQNKICDGKSGDLPCCTCGLCEGAGYTYKKTISNICQNPCPYDEEFYESCYCPDDYDKDSEEDQCQAYKICEVGDPANTKKYKEFIDLRGECAAQGYVSKDSVEYSSDDYTCGSEPACRECNGEEYYQCTLKTDEEPVPADCETIQNQVITYEFSLVRDADQKRKMVIKSENCDGAPHTLGVGLYTKSTSNNTYTHAYGWKCNKEIPLNAGEGLGSYDDVLIYIDFSGLLVPTGPNHNDLQNLDMLYNPDWQGHVVRYDFGAHTSGGWATYYEGHSGYAAYSEGPTYLDEQKSRYKIELPSKGCSPQVRLIFNSEDFPTDGYCVEQDGYYASEEACMKPHTQRSILPYVSAGISGDNVLGNRVDYSGGAGIGCLCAGAGTGSGTPAGLGHGGLYGPRPTGETAFFAFSDCCLDMLQFDESKFEWEGDSLGQKARKVFIDGKRELLNKVFGGDTYNTNRAGSDLKYFCEYQERSGCYVKKVEIPNSCFDYKDAHFESLCTKEANGTKCKFRVTNSYDNYNGYYFPLFMYHLNIKVKNTASGEITQKGLTTGMGDNWKTATYDGEVVGCELERDDTPSVVGDSENSHILWQSEGPDCALDKILGENCSLE